MQDWFWGDSESRPLQFTHLASEAGRFSSPRPSVCPMHVILKPWHILFAVLCGWLNERQQRGIEFQNDQIEVLFEKLGKKRVPLTDDRRRVLAG